MMNTNISVTAPQNVFRGFRLLEVQPMYYVNLCSYKVLISKSK